LRASGGAFDDAAIAIENRRSLGISCHRFAGSHQWSASPVIKMIGMSVRSIAMAFAAFVADQKLQRFANRNIVINNEHD
jgi:hypothetical protein